MLDAALGGDAAVAAKLATSSPDPVAVAAAIRCVRARARVRGNGGALARPPARVCPSPTPRARPLVRCCFRRVMRSFPSLVRVHFHCLAFHVIAMAHAADARPPPPWGAARAAVAAGSVAATLQACGGGGGGDALHGRDLSFLAPRSIIAGDPEAGGGAPGRVALTAESPVGEWSWAVAPGGGGGTARVVEFAFAPVVVCAVPARTVGLGDAISAAGLLWQLSV